MQRVMRLMAALAVFVLATGTMPTPQAQLLPSVSTAAAIDCIPEEDPTCLPPCVLDPTLCDPCFLDPTLCDPCFEDPTLCDPCFEDPTLCDPCVIDSTSPGCPEEPGSITIDKSVTSVDPVTGEAGTYLVSYLVSVVNNSPEAADLIVQDEFLMGGSVFQGTPTATGPDGVPLDGEWDGEGHPQLTESFSLPGKPEDPESTVNQAEFTVAIEVSLLGGEPDLCPTDDPTHTSGAFNNVARVHVGEAQEVAAADSACAEIPTTDLTVTKSVEDGPTYDADSGSWSVQYWIDVHNWGEGSAEYSLTDFPEFGDRAYITNWTVLNNQTDGESSDSYSGGGFDVTDEPTSIDGLDNHSYLVTIEFDLDGGRSETDYCSKGGSTGLYNEVTMLTDNVQLTASDCTDAPMSNVSYDKEVASVRYPAADEVAVTFTVTVSNEGSEESPAWREPYLFFDAPLETLGIEPIDLELIDVVGGVDDEDFTWEYGSLFSDLGLGAMGNLDPDASHTFEIEVTYLVNTDPEGSFWGECSELSLDSSPSGLTNVVIYNFGSFGPVSFEAAAEVVEEEGPAPFDYDYACVPVSTVTFDKTVYNDYGGTLTAEDVVFEIKDGDEVLQTGGSGDTVVIAEGEYTIVERPVAGYTSRGVFCEAVGGGDDGDEEEYWEFQADGVSTDFYLEADVEYVCSVTNYDTPADLAIDKSDGGATLVAGGAAVTYTLTVTNEGGFASEGNDAIVTDELPAGLVWVPGSVTGCTSPTIVGQTMSCRIPAAQIIPDATFAITVQATLPANGASGDYINLAYVTIDSEIQAGSVIDCNNESDTVDCETTPAIRQAAITATKVSNAVGSKKTGDLVAYTLVVTNAGPSTLLPGAVLTDDLPEGLQLVSVSAPGWVCGAVDPVVCSSDAVVNPGTSLPPIVINTKVTATGNLTITNTGVFTAIVDTDDEMTGTAFDAAATVTVQASASAVASILIDQGSAPPVIGPLPETGGSPQGILLSAMAALAAGFYLLRLRRLRSQS